MLSGSHLLVSSTLGPNFITFPNWQPQHCPCVKNLQSEESEKSQHTSSSTVLSRPVQLYIDFKGTKRKNPLQQIAWLVKACVCVCPDRTPMRVFWDDLITESDRNSSLSLSLSYTHNTHKQLNGTFRWSHRGTIPADISLLNLQQKHSFSRQICLLWFKGNVNWLNDKRGQGKGMYGPHPAVALFFKAVSTQLAFKGMKKDAKVPKHMSNACFCPKKNTASFRWYAKGLPAQ